MADKEFQIGLAMAGAISAGAYTAGVLDFLVEALDAWTQRRDGDAPVDGSDPVPDHKVVLRFMAGTSGGGVNAAIFARAMNYRFDPVSQATADDVAAKNPFYDVWVNQLNLTDMLTTTDLSKPGATIVSLLNSDPIVTAASGAINYANTPIAASARSWLGTPLRLFLTLTNLNGMPYRISFGKMTLSDGKIVDLRQSYVAHADYARFAVVYSNQTWAATDARPDEFVLGFDNARLPYAMHWSDFGQYALGTSAFPIGFKPQTLTRPLTHYQYRLYDNPPPAPPAAAGEAPSYWPLIPDWAAIQDWAGGVIPETYSFTAVDGGVCDNEPIELVRTALAGITGSNPRKGEKANRAVLLVDPFAGSSTMADPLKPDVLSSASALVSTMLQQLRYDTRDLLLAADDNVFSRFMITAQRGNAVGDKALATAGLGAFIGFACPEFRRHDYLLGRKNCQDYLRNVLVLPALNKLFDTWRKKIDLAPYQITDESGSYLPIIPLVDACRIDETTDAWPAGQFDPESLRPAIETRLARLLSSEFAKGPLSDVLSWLAGKAAGGSVADFIIGKMQNALTDWQLQVQS